MSEKVSEDAKPEKKTVANYAEKVFKESSVTAVSSICSTVNRPRKIFRSLVLLLCVTGFIYQCTVYLIVVFQYPTAVDIDIERPIVHTMPGLTFCNNNGFVRSKFCAKYPRRCFLPDEEFCSKFAPYCGEERTLVPKSEYYYMEEEMTLDDFKELGQNSSDFVTKNFQSFVYNITPEDIEGPFFRIKTSPYMKLVCYTWHSRVDSPLDAKKYNRYLFGKEPVSSLSFRVREEDLFNPGTNPGIIFAVHSPYQAINPLIQGTFLRPGARYKMFVEVEEEILQPDPYDTKCINYTDIWIHNNRSGPLMQEMCQHRCILAGSMKFLNCSHSVSMYPTDARPCTAYEENDVKWPKEIVEETKTCHGNCRDDCSKTKYYVDTEERLFKKYKYYSEGSKVELIDRSNRIFVDIYMEDEEVITFRHTPKYLPVEIFGVIGGFMGGWLGMSLIQFADLSESLFRIIRYIIRRTKTGSSSKPSNSYEM